MTRAPLDRRIIPHMVHSNIRLEIYFGVFSLIRIKKLFFSTLEDTKSLATSPSATGLFALAI